MTKDFDEILQDLIKDERTKRIPILYLVEVLIILDDMNII